MNKGLCSVMMKWNGGELQNIKRECGFESHLTEISAKKRRDTGKDAGRWRRPSYFEKSE